jgi:hypothetical protein
MPLGGFESLALAVVVVVSAFAALVRGIWIYTKSRWLRGVFLGLLVAGNAAMVLVVLVSSAPPWFFGVGLFVGYGPVCLWLIVRSITYTGPPPGLQKGPRFIEKVEDAVDPVADVAARIHVGKIPRP